MWLFFMLLIAVCIGIGLAVSDENKKKQASASKKHYVSSQNSASSISQNNDIHKLTAYEVNQKILQMIDREFERIEWTMWDSSVHRAEGQFERLERASFDKTMSVVDYNFDSKTAIVMGGSSKTYTVSENSCSCPDFKARNMPCKHMYHLAINLPDIIAKKQYTELAKGVTVILDKYLSDEITSKEADDMMLQINLRMDDCISIEDLDSDIPEQISDSIYDTILLLGKQVLDEETEERKAMLLNENTKLKRLIK